jgi:hypothetical protein
MKKTLLIPYIMVLLLCTACDSSKQKTDIENDIVLEPIQDSSESILDSYYVGQNSHAFKMIKKTIFNNLLDDWVDNSIKNPKWNYESFTEYHILDHELGYIDSDKELYYCTFSADDNKYGYIVVSYDGESLQKINVIETQYLYDLQENIDEIVDKLSEEEIDLFTTVASRVQLVDKNKNLSNEAILFTDSSGNKYIYSLGSLEVVKY